MRVLVTGASGTIGAAVCDALLARGDEVVGLTRDPRKAKGTNPTVNWHAWQASTERPPPQAFVGVDAVVNLIGEEINQRLTDQAKGRIRESRITGSRNLLQGIAALGERPKVFVGQSAIGYYGDRGERMLDEEARPGEGFGAEVPVEWEAAQQEAAELGMRLVILRTGLILGVGGPLAGGDQYMSWIHLDDEVGMILWALDNDQVSGVINATAPNPVTNKEFSKALGGALGRPSFFPAPKLAVAALRGRELAELVTGSTRVIPRRAQDLGYGFRYPEIGAALEAALR